MIFVLFQFSARSTLGLIQTALALRLYCKPFLLYSNIVNRFSLVSSLLYIYIYIRKALRTKQKKPWGGYGKENKSVIYSNEMETFELLCLQYANVQ